jgi:hypothetical protein
VEEKNTMKSFNFKHPCTLVLAYQALSEWITRQSINEILDMVPVNKVIAFGSDARENIEVVYGYLVMMREVLAEALSERIHHGRINLEDARYIANLWFDHNPKHIYRLG